MVNVKWKMENENRIFIKIKKEKKMTFKTKDLLNRTKNKELKKLPEECRELKKIFSANKIKLNRILKKKE